MKYKLIILVLCTGLFFSCTKLHETINGSLNGTQGDAGITATNLLNAAYYSQQPAIVDQAGWYICSEHASDELCGPTRGPNWGDGGKWRIMHQHIYNPLNDGYLNSTFENLLILQFNATNVLNFNPSTQQAAEAKFLRSFARYLVLSGWGQVPTRREGTDLKALPVVLKDGDALDSIITELTSIIPDLPAGSPSTCTKANKDAAIALLMKCYLNKGVYASAATRQTPTFDNADMQQVLTLAGQLSSGYSIGNGGQAFYDNFSPTSLTASTENIYGFQSSQAADGAGGNNVRSRWFSTLNYQHNPGGWNGFSTLSDFYNKFEATDVRRSFDYPGLKAASGLNAGFLIGQQYHADGTPILHSSSSNGGPALIITPTLSPDLQESGDTLDVTGIRVIKWVPDYNGANGNNDPHNVMPFLRYADVLLMTAEANFRMGNSAAALTTMNLLRVARGASPLAALTASDILDERGRELYEEQWRREDQIRFGTYLLPNQTKPGTDDAHVLFFPIPPNDLAGDPNLVQNPGYE